MPQNQQGGPGNTVKPYKIEDNEKHLYHVMVHLNQFDPKTGKPVTKPRICKYDPKEWPMVKKELEKQGYSLTVLNDPTKKEGK